jgi:hypothetical protein
VANPARRRPADRHGATFASAARIALVVGTLLTVVNLDGAIVGGRAGWITLVQVGANYAIPYVVAEVGALLRSTLEAEGVWVHSAMT